MVRMTTAPPILRAASGTSRFRLGIEALNEIGANIRDEVLEPPDRGQIGRRIYKPIEAERVILDSRASERGDVSGTGRHHLDAAPGKGAQERNSKVMIFSADAEQRKAQDVILLAAFAQPAPIRGMWQTCGSPAVRSARRAAHPEQSMQHGIFKPTLRLRNVERRHCHSANDVVAARGNVINIGFENLAALRGTQKGLRTGFAAIAAWWVARGAVSGR